jgi:hypothetical protein
MVAGSNGDRPPHLRRCFYRHPVRTPHHPTKGNQVNPNPNSTYTPNLTFGLQRVLNHVPRNQEDERLALQRLNRLAPDLLGMVMGHVL